MDSGLDKHQLANVWYKSLFKEKLIANSSSGIECPDLDDPKYGTVRVSGTTPGSRADYKCNAGFQLVGVAWRKCQDNGRWTGQAPTCKSMIQLASVLDSPLFCTQICRAKAQLCTHQRERAWEQGYDTIITHTVTSWIYTQNFSQELSNVLISKIRGMAQYVLVEQLPDQGLTTSAMLDSNLLEWQGESARIMESGLAKHQLANVGYKSLFKREINSKLFFRN